MCVLNTSIFLVLISTVIYFRWYYIGRKYNSSKNLENQLIIITGATSGIGLSIAKDLSKRSARLVLAVRDIKVGEAVKQELINISGNSNILVEHLDLTSLKSVLSFCERLLKHNTSISALINNAGIFYHPPENTQDQLDITFQTNFLAQYVLTIKLIPLLRAIKSGSRIVFVSSQAHQYVDRFPQKEFHTAFEDSEENRFLSYQYSKFCQILFAKKLEDILAGSKISVHCVDPGNVETNIFRHFPLLSTSWTFYLQKPIRLLIVKTANEGSQVIIEISPNY